MTREESKSCICTIKMLQKLAYNIHGVMDVIDADNCKKIIKALEQEQKTGRWFLSGGYWRCSECKEKALLKLDKSMGGCKEYMPIKSKYCYNCGAKMQEEE